MGKKITVTQSWRTVWPYLYQLFCLRYCVNCYRANRFSVKGANFLSSFHPIFPILTRPFSSLSLQFSLRPPYHRVKLYENLRSAIWKLRGSFFLSLVQPISVSKGIKRKELVYKDKQWKKWNDAEISVAFSAQNPILCGFIEVCQCISEGEYTVGKRWKRRKERDFLWIPSAFRVASAPKSSAVLSVSVLMCC